MSDHHAESGGRLPPRAPRSLTTHWLVSSAVCFLVVVVVGLFFGLSLRTIAVISIVVGAVAAPFTRRAEIRALAARDDR